MSQNLNFFQTHYVYDQARVPKTSTKQYSIEPALNNILESVRTQGIKYKPKPAVPRIPRAIADTMKQATPEVLLAGKRNKPKKRNDGKRSISQLQADLDVMHSGRRNLTSDMMGFRNQQRYREVLRQKRILENMLQEHQKLQSDRDSIACEINYMRSYLDSIRNKLDVSLRKLNSQKTVSNQACPPKKCVRIQPRPNTFVKKPVSVSPQSKYGRGTRTTTNTNTRQKRISGGGYTKAYPMPKRTSATRTALTAMGDKRNANVCLNKKPAKQWVYCTRIDRSAERSRLH